MNKCLKQQIANILKIATIRTEPDSISPSCKSNLDEIQLKVLTLESSKIRVFLSSQNGRRQLLLCVCVCVSTLNI